MAALGKDANQQTNMGVDYVVSFRFDPSDKKAAVQQFEMLVQALASVGLATEVRNGEGNSLLVFVKVASEDHLFGEVYRSRVKDWINGVRAAAPEKETKQALKVDPLYEAERLRIIYQLITNPTSEGGAGITPKSGEWKSVESVFPLHDHAANKKLMKKLAGSMFFTTEDLDEIRDKFGEKIAYYFAFTQFYFSFLLFPAAAGVSAWLLLGNFSPFYAVFSCLWCIIFTEYWKHKETDLAVRWGVRNVSRIECKRKEFVHEKMITDPVTGEQVPFFSNKKRLQRQLLQLPFALGVALALGSLIATCFGIEVFISEIYDGPLKWLLVFLPTGILTTVMPVLVNIFTSVATRLTQFENYETQDAYDTAMTQKIFVINFITSYLGIFLTAFVYVPFGTLIVPYLDIFSLTVRPFAENKQQMECPPAHAFEINPDRLRTQVIYFTVTAQIVNQALEVLLPYVKREAFSKYKKFQNQRAMSKGGASSLSDNDAPEEKAFLARVRQEAELGVYDVTADLREMVLQFGYLSLFSVVWPLTAVSFVVNDWFELRTDAFKITAEMQRPTPWRADTIGPWLDSLGFLAWLGSITTSALIYLFRDGVGPAGSPKDITSWALLLSIIFGEHLFLLTRWVVRIAVSKIESPGLQKERRERFLVRKKYFDESLSQLSRLSPVIDNADEPESITRESLEEDQRNISQAGHDGVEEKFWRRQRGWRETAKIGAALIERVLPDEDKKSQ
ncbi:uncharacterized protein PV09_00992 [Verruconis gallopava]|uniref:Uncharacterized protein n=1 Tax=Verruconis gallopava TaxID=253628 RepID=A0A0D1Z525_9PEZI|nr:uncharacterized protein PV09_00992 [Verruconis gallopava]KIW08047.1 hypothetical protein PV09_00992 [Verruconis gallopava]